MRVRMKQRIGGYRNGAEWPPVGGEIELPDHEARDLCAAGYASEVPDARGEGRSGAAPGDGPPAEPAYEPDEGTSSEPAEPAPAKPRGRPRKA